MRRLLNLLCFLVCSSGSILVAGGSLNGGFDRQVRVAPLSNAAAARQKRFLAGRGGGASASHDDTKSQAITSLQHCYKAAFFSTFVDIFDALRDTDIDWNNLTWGDAVHFLDSLNILGFGIGLFMVTKLYAKEVKDITTNDLLRATRIMASLWWNAAVVLMLGLLTLASGSGVWFYVGPAFVVIGGFLGALFIDTSDPPPVKDPAMQEVRTMGFLASRNMALCMGAFCIDGIVQCVTIWTESGPSIFERILGMSDVSKALVIASLLRTLYYSYRDAVITATSNKKVNEASYHELYEAQKGFYNKIGGTLLGSAFVKLCTPLLAKCEDVVVDKLGEWFFAD